MYSRLISIELTQTDLPEPVEPAMSRCGILLRSQSTLLPSISLPRATVREPFASANSCEPNISLIRTICLFLLGISMPTAAFPGIGASILMDCAASLRAMSSERFLILLILTPGAGLISYLVTVGPRLIWDMDACTPYSASVLIRFCAVSVSSCPSSAEPLFLGGTSSLTVGYL